MLSIRHLARSLSGLIVLGSVAALSFGETPTAPVVITAPLDGAVYPRDFAAPTFRWRGSSTDASWEVRIDTAERSFSARVVGKPEWKPGDSEWESVKQASLGKSARFSARLLASTLEPGRNDPATVTFSTSPDPVDASVFYREVPLPVSFAMDHKASIRWRVGRVSVKEPPRTVLSGMRTCANCHSFSADGKTIAMDLDFGSDKGAYAVATVSRTTRIGPDQMMTWNDFRRQDGEGTFGLLSTISPDGRFVVSTVKETIFLSFLTDMDCSQLFFPTRGILAVWNRDTRKFHLLEGAADPAYVQTNPVFAPDGRTLVFARVSVPKIPRRGAVVDAAVVAALTPDFVEGRRNLRFDLWQVPFNDGRGGESTRIAGAGENGQSNFFPRFSPDGKWLVFCQASSMMLNRPDSTLSIMPAGGGTPRRMRCNALGRMNSWHSFSPNGHWLVFASKASGPLTQLWLTHIDENGVDTVPVMLEGFVADGMAGNIPEFVNWQTDELQQIVVAEEITGPSATLPRRPN